MSRSFTLSGFGSSADGNTALTIANSVVVSNATSNVIVSPLSVAIGNSSVFNSINATSYNGTANNSLYLGGTAAASYVTTSSIGGLTANNTAYLNGLIASGYQTTAGLSANVATLAANSATYANSSSTNTFTVGTAAYYVANGNMGIGNTAPTDKLSVNGTTYYQGNVILGSASVVVGLQANGGYGTAGQVLTSNGTATYWSTVSSGSSYTFSTGLTNTSGTITVNSSYIATISANNASYLGGVAAASYANTSGAYTFTGIHTYNVGGNTIYMANTTSNWISWGTGGVAAPSVTTKSAGTKLVLYEGTSAASVDYAIGIESYHLWFSTTTTAGGGFKWYANTTNIMTANTTGLYMTGTLAINSSGGALVANNSSYLGGTAAASYLTTSGASGTYLQLAGGTMTGTITNSNNSIAIGTNGGVNRGYLYNDATGFGLLTSGGAWAVQVGYGTNTVYFAGIGQSAASFRAPIFYDSDNTGYYVDPASTSNMNVVTSTSGYYYLLSASGGVNTTSSPLLYADVTNTVLKPGSGNGAMLFQNYAGANKGSITYSTGACSFALLYDFDNSGYYVDPASTSNMNIVGATRYNLTSSNSTYAYGDGYGWQFAGSGYVYFNQSGVTYAQTRIQARSGISNDQAADLILYGGTSGYTTITGSARAPLFYDSDNTGYYVDPASTSNMNTVNMLTGYWRSYQNTAYGGPVGAYVGYSTALEGAGTSFHRGGAYAINMGLDSDNVFRIGGWSAAANRLVLDMSGNFYVAGNVTAYSSDERLKENIVTISDPIGMLKRLRGVFYDWKEWVNEDFGFNPIDRHDIGVIAQETQKVIPQAVKTAGFDTGLHGKSETGERYLTVQMEKIIPVLIESMKELVNRVEYLEAELAKK